MIGPIQNGVNKVGVVLDSVYYTKLLYSASPDSTEVLLLLATQGQNL